jgi:hypothetical protein
LLHIHDLLQTTRVNITWSGRRYHRLVSRPARIPVELSVLSGAVFDFQECYISSFIILGLNIVMDLVRMLPALYQRSHKSRDCCLIVVNRWQSWEPKPHFLFYLFHKLGIELCPSKLLQLDSHCNENNTVTQNTHVLKTAIAHSDFAQWRMTRCLLGYAVRENKGLPAHKLVYSDDNAGQRWNAYADTDRHQNNPALSLAFVGVGLPATVFRQVTPIQDHGNSAFVQCGLSHAFIICEPNCRDDLWPYRPVRHAVCRPEGCVRQALRIERQSLVCSSLFHLAR